MTFYHLPMLSECLVPILDTLQAIAFIRISVNMRRVNNLIFLLRLCISGTIFLSDLSFPVRQLPLGQ